MKKIAAVIIPVAAFAALVGTGFGSWYFAQSGATTSANATVAVTAAETKMGTLSLGGCKAMYFSRPADRQFQTFTDNSFSLILDQKHDAYWSMANDESAEDKAAATADLAPNQINAIHAKYTYDSDIPIAYGNLVNGWTLTMKFEITEGKDIFDQYLKFDDENALEASFDYRKDNPYRLEPKMDTSKDDWFGNELHAVYAIPTVSFTNKPTTLSAYNTMKDAMASVKFKVTGTMALDDSKIS